MDLILLIAFHAKIQHIICIYKLDNALFARIQ